MARILMVSSEAHPFSKTGGLADVLGSLPPALVENGEEVAVVLPRYRTTSLSGARKIADGITLWIGPGRYSAALWLVHSRGVDYYLVDCPVFFDREGLYAAAGKDYWDNDTRFAALCHAALAVARHFFRPHVIHCHDWQAGLLPAYLHQYYATDPTFHGVKTVFTIHNLGYQGIFHPGRMFWLGLPDSLLRPDLIEFHGSINFLKAGLVYSDALTTVSPTYAREIQTPEQGFGLDGLLRARSTSLTGILNGIDYSVWNTESNPHLAAPYSHDALEGKRACKLDLLRTMGLPTENPDVPVIGIVSRFASQKGFDLIAKVAYDLIHWDIKMAVLGSGEAQYEALFRTLAEASPDKFAVRVAFDNALAHKIEAGADMFLMPSHYEPCGLNQMYSLRYGTVPIVHATGGLDDTIDFGTGFKFWSYTGEAMLGALREAVSVYSLDADRWNGMMRLGMQKDFSWSTSAAAYSRLYAGLLA